MSSLLKIENVTKVYKGQEISVKALDNISFEISEGDFITIMGSSGSGKTTLLNCISTIDKPTEGSIIFDGRDISKLDENTLADYRSQNISFIFQSYNLINTLNVLENIVLPLQIKKINVKNNMDKIIQTMKELGILELKDKYPSQLSGGQQQRIAAARAIINNAKILIADEPTGALDSKTSEDIMDLFIRLNQEQNTTMIMVTHDRAVAEKADRIFHILDGRIQEEEVIS